MATTFPATALDTMTDPASTATLAATPHATQHKNHNDQILALETKVGINSSAATTTLDYKIARRVATDATSTLAEGVDLVVGTATGSRIGTGATQKIGLYGATPVVQASRAGQLTDSSGGTSGGATIAAIGGAIDPTAALKADTANAIATLAAKVNALETMIHNLGISA